MNHRFIKKEKNLRLLIIFGGWSTDSEYYQHIMVPDDWDLLVITSYTDFNFNEDLLKGYKIIGVIAWSFGVFAALKSLKNISPAFSIAINGSPFPISDFYGIPENVFWGTLENLNFKNLLKFRKRSGMKNTDATFTDNQIDLLKQELTYIYKESKKNLDPKELLRFTRTYISKEDKIFPIDNLRKAWKKYNPETDIIEIQGLHEPDFTNLIEGLLFSRKKIGEKFKKSLPTYDNFAESQKTIVKNLISKIPKQSFASILEIGPGSGLLTGEILSSTKPSRYDMIELYEKKSLYDFQNQIIGDAEDILNDLPDESYELIISSNTVQWFLDPAGFIKNCHRILKHGGYLIFSTFSPLNLNELREFNPYPLLYRNTSEYKKLILLYFNDLEISEEKIIMNFKSPRDLMLHLIKTGVGASKVSNSGKSLLNSKINKLTFSPVYIKARK